MLLLIFVNCPNWQKKVLLSQVEKLGFGNKFRYILYPLQSYRKWPKLLQINNKDNVTNNFLEIYKKVSKLGEGVFFEVEWKKNEKCKNYGQP